MWREDREGGERAGAKGAAWGERRDAVKRTRQSSGSDQDQPPPTRARGARGGYRRSAATGSNRLALGTRQTGQQIAAAPEEDEPGANMEVVAEMAEEMVEVGVRLGMEEEESDAEEISSQQAQ